MKNPGFTLVETLVSLFVLSIAITATFAIITFNLNRANCIKNSFIASGLAQEGDEGVRNLRDTDWFKGNPFGSLGGPLAAGGTYCVQWDSEQLISSCSNPLKKDAGGLYTYDSGQNTIFSRTVTVTSVSAAELKITVDVSWPDHGGTKQVSAEEHLFDWY